jgi:hypothetical protein
MTWQRFLAPAAFLGLLAASPCLAGPPSIPKIDTAGLLPALAGGSTDALAGALRGYLIKSLPDPIYESWQDWGRQKPNLRGKMKNDGRWKHIKVNVLAPADTLVFDIRDVHNPESGRMTFTVVLTFDARGEYEVQHWESGIRLRSSSIRARCRIHAILQCEATFRLESADGLLPDAVFRLRVVNSRLGYDNFVTEHIAGVGGEMAELIGSATRSGLKQWHPSLERDLLAKANASIEKAGDTKEVRVSLFDLLKKKGWLPSTPVAPPAPPPAAPIPMPAAVGPEWQPVFGPDVTERP